MDNFEDLLKGFNVSVEQDGEDFSLNDIVELNLMLRYGEWYDWYLRSKEKYYEVLDSGKYEDLECAQSVYYIDGKFILACNDENLRKSLREEQCSFGRRGYPRPQSKSGRVFEAVKSYHCIFLSACERMTGVEYSDWRVGYKDKYGYADVYNYIKNGEKSQLIYFWMDEIDNMNAINRGEIEYIEDEMVPIAGDLRTSCGEITLDEGTLTIVTRNSIYKFNVIKESRIYPYRKVFHYPFHKS